MKALVALMIQQMTVMTIRQHVFVHLKYGKFWYNI